MEPDRETSLSLAAAKENYGISKDNFLGEIEQLEDPDRGAVDEPQLRAEYTEIKYSERKLLKAA